MSNRNFRRFQMLVLILLCYLSCLVSAAEVGFLPKWKYRNSLGEVENCCLCRRNFGLGDVIEECFSKNRNDYTNLPFCTCNGENIPKCPQKVTVCQKNITCDTNKVYSQCKVPFLDNAILTCGDNLHWEHSFRCPGTVEVADPRQGYYNNKSNIPDGKACGIDTYIAISFVNLVYMTAMMMALKLWPKIGKMFYPFILFPILSVLLITLFTLLRISFIESVPKKNLDEMYKIFKSILDIVGCVILPLNIFVLSWKFNKKHERCGKQQKLSGLMRWCKLVIHTLGTLFIGLFSVLSAVYLIIYIFVQGYSSVTLWFLILFIIWDIFCVVWFLALILKPQNFKNNPEVWTMFGQLLILNLSCQWLQFTEPTIYYDKKSGTYTQNMVIRWTEISMLILYLIFFELILFSIFWEYKKKQASQPEDVELAVNNDSSNSSSSSSNSNNSSSEKSDSSIPAGIRGKNNGFGESMEGVTKEGLASGNQDNGARPARKIFIQGANNDKVSSKNEELERLWPHCQPTSDEDVENIPHRITSQDDYAADEACVDEPYVELESDVSFSENLVVQKC